LHLNASNLIFALFVTLLSLELNLFDQLLRFFARSLLSIIMATSEKIPQLWLEHRPAGRGAWGLPPCIAKSPQNVYELYAVTSSQILFANSALRNSVGGRSEWIKRWPLSNLYLLLHLELCFMRAVTWLFFVLFSNGPFSASFCTFPSFLGSKLQGQVDNLLK